MPFSVYELSVPVFLRGFAVLSVYLDKAEAFASENKIGPEVLINARLAPDMMTFAGQIQRASDAAKGGVAGLASIDAPAFPDTETSFGELRERIAKTVAWLKTVKPEQFEGSESRTIPFKAGGFNATLRGDTFFLQMLLPNFFFHITTAHDILRHNGVQIGKADYFGKVDFLEVFA
jgi:uncharacterized protein